MDARQAQKSKRGLAFYAFFLAAFSCALGLSFCLIKSPQARSDAYLAAAVTAMDRNQDELAARTALEAVRLNPMAVQGWQILSRILLQKGDMEASRQALEIAAKVQQNPADAVPVYAMPAEFKLSLLALAEPVTR